MVVKWIATFFVKTVMIACLLFVVFRDQLDDTFVLGEIIGNAIGQVNQKLAFTVLLGNVLNQNRCVEAAVLFGIVR